MHIAHFTNTYLPRISGVVHSVSAFRKGLTELGHLVFVFAQDPGDYKDEEPFIFRYPTVKIPLPDDFPATIPISPFVDRLLPSLKPDVIHTHHPFLLGQAAATKAKELNLPLVFTFHTQYREYTHYLPLPQEQVQDFVRGAIENWLGDFMHRCQHIVVPSKSIMNNLRENYGIEERLTAIPTGIDLRPYQEAEGQPTRKKHGWENKIVLVTVGRLAQEKNFTTLLAASAQAMQNHEDLILVIIGDGDDRKSLEKYARELDIADSVEFIGRIPFEDIPKYLKASDLFGFASVTETQGLVTMEALAAGLPVVAVDAPGTRDVVDHGEQGLLTENDSAALGNAIDRILREDLLLSFKKAADQKAHEFDFIKQAEKLVSVYEQAIEDKKAGRFVKIKKTKS